MWMRILSLMDEHFFDTPLTVSRCKSACIETCVAFIFEVRALGDNHMLPGPREANAMLCLSRLPPDSFSRRLLALV